MPCSGVVRQPEEWQQWAARIGSAEVQQSTASQPAHSSAHSQVPPDTVWRACTDDADIL